MIVYKKHQPGLVYIGATMRRNAAALYFSLTID